MYSAARTRSAIRGDEVFRAQRRTFAHKGKDDGVEQSKRVLGTGAGNAAFVVAGEFAQTNLVSV